jgi:hypothetical protein
MKASTRNKYFMCGRVSHIGCVRHGVLPEEDSPHDLIRPTNLVFSTTRNAMFFIQKILESYGNRRKPVLSAQKFHLIRRPNKVRRRSLESTERQPSHPRRACGKCPG